MILVQQIETLTDTKTHRDCFYLKEAKSLCLLPLYRAMIFPSEHKWNCPQYPFFKVQILLHVLHRFATERLGRRRRRELIRVLSY